MRFSQFSSHAAACLYLSQLLSKMHCIDGGKLERIIIYAAIFSSHGDMLDNGQSRQKQYTVVL